MNEGREIKNNKVTIWTEGGADTGMSHFVRSLNLASALERLNCDVSFLVNENRTIAERLEEAGYPYRASISPARVAVKMDSSIFAIDSSRNLEKEISHLKNNGSRVVLIGNDGSSVSKADVVIKPSILDKREGNVFRGKDYIAIGDNFFNARHTRGLIKHSTPFKVLVTMGGSDPYHTTDKVIEALKDVPGIEVTIVVGLFQKPSERFKELELECGRNFNFFYGVKDIAPLMTINHIGITTMGSTMYELAYMGLPSIGISHKESELEELQMLRDVGIGTPLGFFTEVTSEDIVCTVKKYMENKELWEATSERARKLYDGQGAVRIADVLNFFASGSSQN